MKPSLKVLFICCDLDSTAAAVDRLSSLYDPDFFQVASRERLRLELQQSDWNLLFATTETDVTPQVVLAELALAGRQIPLMVLCDASTELSALEAVRVGASDAIRVDQEMDRLLPALARELRSALGRGVLPAGGRGESDLQRATSALLHLARTRSFLGDNLIDDLRQITETAGIALSISRASVWLYNEGHEKIRCIDLYHHDRNTHEDGTELYLRDHPAYFLAIEHQRLIVAHEAREDPRTREYRDHYLEPFDIYSMMDAAIRSHGELHGVVCLEQTGAVRYWTAEEELFAAALADLVSLALEASERQAAETRLRDTEISFRELFEHTGDAMLILTRRDPRQWKIEAMNGPCEAALGVRASDCVGLTPCQALEADLPEDAERAFREALRTATAITRPHVFERKGVRRWYNTVIVPLKDSQGVLTRIACLSRDETDHREFFERLRDREHRQQLHLQQSALGAIEWTLDGRVAAWNPACEQIFGYLAAEAMGRHMAFIIPSDFRLPVDAIWNALISQKGGTRSHNKNIHKDGRVIDCEWYNTALVDEKGRTIGAASFVQDVTGRASAAG
jgi:PAS domain S-box-containing protein